MEGTNPNKSTNSLVWTQDLIHELKKVNIPDHQIKQIISTTPIKVSIPFGTKKFLTLVDYNDFILSIEKITKKRVPNEIRNVDNFRKAIKEARKSHLSKNTDSNVKDELPVNSFKREENKKLVIPTVEEISQMDIKFPEPKWDKVNNEVDYYYDYVSCIIEGVLEKNKYRDELRAKEGIVTNSNVPSNLGSLKESLIKEKTNQVERKKFVADSVLNLKPNKKSFGERLWSKLKNGAIQFVDFLIPDMEESLEEETASNDFSFESYEKEFIFKNAKQRDKDVKYKMYLICQKLMNENLLEMSNEDILELASNNKKYLKVLNKKKKEEIYGYDYETEMALLVGQKIDEALSVSSEHEKFTFQNCIKNIQGIKKYLESYVFNLKDYFSLPEKKATIIDFPIDKTFKKNLLKICASTIVASLSLTFFNFVSTSDNKEENVKIEQEDTMASSTNFGMKMKSKVNEKEQISERIQKELNSAVSENQLTIHTLAKEGDNSLEEEKKYFLIGDTVCLVKGSRVFTFAPDLTDSSKSQKPYYDANLDIGRTIRSVVLKDENTVITVHTNEEVDYYLNNNYEVLGYQIDNMYSYQNGIYCCSEGFYEKNALEKKYISEEENYYSIDANVLECQVDNMYSYQVGGYYYSDGDGHHEENVLERKLVP